MAVLKDLIVHGASRFLNGIQTTDIQTDSVKANTIAADSGYFNYLKAIDGDITNLTTEQLLATNATVVGLLDVQGEMHTNSWTNANIANIGGSFYIAPTIETAGNVVITYTVPDSENQQPYYTIAVTSAALPVSANTIVTGNMEWKVSSKVMITGSLIINGTDNTTYPLGTCVGKLSALGTDSFTVNEIYNSSSDIPGNSILDGSLHALVEKFGTTINATSENLKISMYEVEGTKPVGIMMTSYGYGKSTYIDIYGGVNVKTSGLVDPNVRIGYLGDGVTSYGLKQFDDSSAPYPQGWGIYTDNGYLKGTIIAESGKIGDGNVAWNIGNDENRAFIWSGISNVYSTTTGNGIYVGTDGILNVSSTEEDNKPYTQITDGILTAQGAKLQNLNIYDINGNRRAGVTNTGFNIYDGASPTTETLLARMGIIYVKTKDTNIDSNKQYYQRVNNNYVLVENPVVANIENYYESIEGIQIGNETQFHITMDSEELGFYQNETSKVAYIKNDEMFIQKSVVAKSLDVGLRQTQTDAITGLNGEGQWSWQVHQFRGQNNLSLKWVG